MFGVQQASIALDALEGIVRRALLVEAEVVPVGLFVIELVDVSSDDNADIEMEEESDDVADDKTDLSTRAENRATRNLVVVTIVTLNQRALGKDEVEGECGQGERGEEANPNEDRVGFDHATVSDNRTNEPEQRDDSDDDENGTGDNEANPSTRRDFDLTVLQKIWSCIDSVDEPEKCTSTETAADEGQKRGNEDGGPNWDAATEVSAGAHRVILAKSWLVCLERVRGSSETWLEMSVHQSRGR